VRTRSERSANFVVVLHGAPLVASAAKSSNTKLQSNFVLQSLRALLDSALREGGA
jgi:hypothetical protein